MTLHPVFDLTLYNYSKYTKTCLFFYLSDGPVGTPASYQEQSPKAVERLIIGVRNHLLLWGFLIKPRLPLLLVTTYLEEM